jgi:hypothetical protein
MNGAMVFAATCPLCNREQLQQGYTIADLMKLLHGGDPIEAYCEFCDELWAVSGQKRGELSEFVAGASGDTPPDTTSTLEDEQ